MRGKILTAVLVTLAVISVQSAWSATGGGQSGGGEDANLAAGIFLGSSDSALPATIDAGKARQSSFPFGPALLLAGVIILAASGRQYACEYHNTVSALCDIGRELDQLVDDSIQVDNGQRELMQQKLDELMVSKQETASALQMIQGGTAL
jgi:hypothetical protein